MSKANPKIIVIGGGAAGFFAAINIAEKLPAAEVHILEKSRQSLAKVRVSGGGRCNVTHHCFDAEMLAGNYPRGGKMLRWAFEEFQPKNTIEWFKKRGVELKSEPDGRMFPVTDSSETIIQTFLKEAHKHGVRIHAETAVLSVEKNQASQFVVHLKQKPAIVADCVVVATGGFRQKQENNWLHSFGHTITEPVPSLFTFNMREKTLAHLAGISVPEAEVKIEGTRFSLIGPVLLTHWGFSGPAVLKLSAFAARELHKREYRFDVKINWMYPLREQELITQLKELRNRQPSKNVHKHSPFQLPLRLRQHLAAEAGIEDGKKWGDVSNTQINDWARILSGSRYNIQGKTTYKEEFVTCGGIPLNEIEPGSLQSKKTPGLYIVGEALDIDGITGGFNFQAAWTTAWLCSEHVAKIHSRKR